MDGGKLLADPPRIELIYDVDAGTFRTNPPTHGPQRYFFLHEAAKKYAEVFELYMRIPWNQDDRLLLAEITNTAITPHMRRLDTYKEISEEECVQRIEPHIDNPAVKKALMCLAKAKLEG